MMPARLAGTLAGLRGALARSPRLMSFGLVLGLVLVAAVPRPAPAQVAGDTPPDLQGIEIREHPGAQVPLDLPFTDEEGAPVRLADYVRGERPVILQLGYYRCPMLCGLVLNAMMDGMKDLDWMPGRDYEVVSISIDPTETPELARAKKENALTAFERPGAGAGWHFLTGREEDIRAVADAVGFAYRYVPERNEYAHAAGIFMLTPRGKVSRTLYGIDYPPRTLRLALVEAGQGKTGNAFDRVLLYCYHYDATSGRYGPAAVKIMQAGGALTALVLGVVLAGLWTRDTRRRGRAPEEDTA